MSRLIEWVLSKNTWIDPKAILPGVWRCKDGGFLIRAQPKSPLTGKKQDIRKVLLDVPDAAGAFNVLQGEIAKIRQGLAPEVPAEIPIFKSYAVQLFQEKVLSGKIKSAAGREKWEGTLRLHLFPATWASYKVNAILNSHIREWWVGDVLPQVKDGTYSPVTVNSWRAVLETVVNSFVDRYQLPINPMRGIERCDESGCGYTFEDPNSLTPSELRDFLGQMKELYPKFYAFVCLGFFTGLRPSHIRTIRRSGDIKDVLWDQGVVLIRRSHSRAQEVMGTTKTGHHQMLSLPTMLMDILRWHSECCLLGKQRLSPLLFPGRGAGLLSPSTLRIPFQRVAEAIGLKKRITPRGMRRTANDLCRMAKIDEEIKRAVTGHRTDKMVHLYSTVAPDEMREAMTAVFQLVGGAPATPPPAGPGPKRGPLRLVK